MSKHYTQSTAALKTVTLDTVILDANKIMVHPGKGPSSDRKNILDIIGDNTKEINYLKNTDYLDTREEVFEDDIWSSSISVFDDENGKRVIKHNNDGIILTGETRLNEASIIHNNKAYFGDLDENFKSEDYINVETDKIVAVKNGKWLPVACIINEGKFNELKCYEGTNTEISTNVDVLSVEFPNLKCCNYGFYGLKNDNKKILIKAKLPKLKTDGYSFQHSDISHFSGDMSSLILSFISFGNCKSLTVFEGDLSSLLIGYGTFLSSESLSDFRGDLSNLLVGDAMFSFTSLCPESVRFIANSLPKIDKTIDQNFEIEIYTDNGSCKKQLLISNGELEADGMFFPVGNISISWTDIESLSEEEKAIILYDIFPIITSKGWTIDTNLKSVTDEASTVDIEENYYKKLRISTTGILNKGLMSLASHRDIDGNLYVIMEAKNVINNDGHWESFESKEMAAQHWGLEAI